jgi:transcriptional regulator with XRE-family HTH domain
MFMSFGETLKALRLKAGMTQAQLSIASQVSVKSIRDYEDGKTEAAPRSVARMAVALKVSVKELATGLAKREG